MCVCVCLCVQFCSSLFSPSGGAKVRLKYLCSVVGALRTFTYCNTHCITHCNTHYNGLHMTHFFLCAYVCICVCAYVYICVCARARVHSSTIFSQFARWGAHTTVARATRLLGCRPHQLLHRRSRPYFSHWPRRQHGPALCSLLQGVGADR